MLDLLLVDESNPRSIGFQLASLLSHLDKLPEHDHTVCDSEKALVAKAIHAVRVAPMAELSRRDKSGHMDALAELLEQLKDDMYDLSDALASHYLSPVVSSRFVSSR